MRSFAKQNAAFITLIVIFGACADKKLETVTTRTSGNYRFVVLSHQGSVKQGAGTLYLEVYNANDDKLLDVGMVEVQARMPMPGMPMVHDAEVEPTDVPGRYAVKYDVSMRGAWTLNITFDENKSFMIPITVK